MPSTEVLTGFEEAVMVFCLPRGKKTLSIVSIQSCLGVKNSFSQRRPCLCDLCVSLLPFHIAQCSLFLSTCHRSDCLLVLASLTPMKSNLGSNWREGAGGRRMIHPQRGGADSVTTREHCPGVPTSASPPLASCAREFCHPITDSYCKKKTQAKERLHNK